MPPRISICMPTLNAREFLEPRMKSILEQTLTDWELIVCDSFSDDGTWKYLQQFKEDPRVRLYQVPKAGLYAGWNECLQRANGEYIHIATADDTCSPVFLERLVALLDCNRDCHLAVCQFAFINEIGEEFCLAPQRRVDAVYGDLLKKDICRPREVELLIHFCQGGIPWVTVSSLIFRTSLLGQVGNFREDVGPNADLIWSLKCSLFSDTLSIPDVAATWRQYEEQASSRPHPQWKMLYLQLLKEVLTEHENDFPESWRVNDHWKDVLLHTTVMSQLRSYRLDRLALIKAPLQLLAGAVSAFKDNPSYLAKRVRTLLTWNAPEFEDEYDCFCPVAKDWNVEVAPKPISFQDSKKLGLDAWGVCGKYIACIN